METPIADQVQTTMQYTQSALKHKPKQKNTAVVVLSIVLVLVLLAGLFNPYASLMTYIRDSKKTVSDNVTEVITADETEDKGEKSEESDSEDSAAVKPNVPETAAEKSYTKRTVSPSPIIARAETTVGVVLPSSNVDSSRSFGADQAIDGYANTCWCVNTSGPGGAGGAFTIYLREKSRVSGIAIINGNTFLPEEDIYRLNGQVKSFTLSFSDGTSMTYEAKFNYATSTYETFTFSSSVVTDRITFRVNSGYQGSRYSNNVCLGEIRVF